MVVVVEEGRGVGSVRVVGIWEWRSGIGIGILVGDEKEGGASSWMIGGTLNVGVFFLAW